MKGMGVALAVAAALWGAEARADAPGRAADHVVIVMLDGARPDALRRARTPVLARLAAEGVSYLRAETVYPSQTRVAFVSLPTGAHPASHGIVGGSVFMDADWKAVPLGDEDPVAAQALVLRPTFFEDATAAGLTSLYAAMKGYELVGARGATWTLNAKEVVDKDAWENRYRPEADGSAERAAWLKELLSRQLLDATLRLFREKKPNLVLLNLGSADYAAHAFGPDSPHYLRTLEFLDTLLGDFVREVERLGLRERTTFVVSADHGFSGVDLRHVVAPADAPGGPQVGELSARGIEHVVSNTGGTSMGLYLRDGGRLREAVSTLRAQPWCEAVYCEDAGAGCDRSLSSLAVFSPGRSPALMVDLDDDVALSYTNAGQHGSMRPLDRRIPLLFSGAGVAAGRVLGAASLVDVAPTVERLLAIEGGRLRPDGRVLTEALAF
jgi:predicted AlkP superfamily pyrophosphatase or phosphodiesterase